MEEEGLLLKHRCLSRLQHAVQSPQDCEREDDLAVVALLVVAAQEVSDGPDEGREVGVGQRRAHLSALIYLRFQQLS